jgi:hypothetical protein
MAARQCIIAQPARGEGVAKQKAMPKEARLGVWRRRRRLEISKAHIGHCSGNQLPAWLAAQKLN